MTVSMARSFPQGKTKKMGMVGRKKSFPKIYLEELGSGSCIAFAPPSILRFSSRRQTARTFKVPGLYLASFKCTTILHISGRHAAVSFVPVNGIYSSYLFGRTRSSVLLCLFVAYLGPVLTYVMPYNGPLCPFLPQI